MNPGDLIHNIALSQILICQCSIDYRYYKASVSVASCARLLTLATEDVMVESCNLQAFIIFIKWCLNLYCRKNTFAADNNKSCFYRIEGKLLEFEVQLKIEVQMDVKEIASVAVEGNVLVFRVFGFSGWWIEESNGMNLETGHASAFTLLIQSRHGCYKCCLWDNIWDGKSCCFLLSPCLKMCYCK